MKQLYLYTAHPRLFLREVRSDESARFKHQRGIRIAGFGLSASETPPDEETAPWLGHPGRGTYPSKLGAAWRALCLSAVAAAREDARRGRRSVPEPGLPDEENLRRLHEWQALKWNAGDALLRADVPEANHSVGIRAWLLTYATVARGEPDPCDSTAPKVPDLTSSAGWRAVDAESGERPDVHADFLAYDAVTTVQRRLDAQTDAQVAQVLRRKVDAMVAQGHNEQVVIHNFAVEFVDVRTEAILLREAGWDVVPLLVRRPALAFVVDGHVVAVRDWRGGLSIHPSWRGKLKHLRSDLQRVEERVLNMREVINNNKGSPANALNTLRLALREHGLGGTDIARVEATVRPSLQLVASSGAPLLKYALAMWKRARTTPPRAPTPAPRTRTPAPPTPRTRNRRT